MSMCCMIIFWYCDSSSMICKYLNRSRDEIWINFLVQCIFKIHVLRCVFPVTEEQWIKFIYTSRSKQGHLIREIKRLVTPFPVVYILEQKSSYFLLLASLVIELVVGGGGGRRKSGTECPVLFIKRRSILCWNDSWFLFINENTISLATIKQITMHQANFILS